MIIMSYLLEKIVIMAEIFKRFVCGVGIWSKMRVKPKNVFAS